jgi:5-formyltetrahydrofolate cyclo-ligase
MILVMRARGPGSWSFLIPRGSSDDVSFDPFETPREIKRRLRREVVERILSIEPNDRADQERFLADHFPRLPGFDTASTALLYVSHLPEEFETKGMIRLASSLGKVVACPRVDRAARRLRLFRVEDVDADLVPGPFGIPEPGPEAEEISPDRIDWALVPGIAFDPRGFRLGRGAGYYDRLLPTLRPEVLKLSLIFEAQRVESLPVEPHDRPVDGVVGAGRSWFRDGLID